jgi:hypothetical protein
MTDKLDWLREAIEEMQESGKTCLLISEEGAEEILAEIDRLRQALKERTQ